jgi:acetoin utilization protein AcuB
MDKTVIHKNIPVIKPTDTLERAASLIKEMNHDALPVVKQRKLLGVLLESDIEHHAQDQTWRLDQNVGSIEFDRPITTRWGIHPYEMMKQFHRVPYCFLPVLDSEENYVGVIFKDDVIDELNAIFRVFDEGTVMEFEVPAHLFRMSEMIKMIEQNDARVLSLTSRPSPSSPAAQIITTKTEARDPYRLQQTMEKYGYPVIYSSINSSDTLNDFAFKAKEFMKYLET